MLFQSDGTFSPPNDVQSINFILRGGGGSGAKGGGGGAACVAGSFPHTPGQTYSVQIGQGGAANCGGDHGGTTAINSSNGLIASAVGGGPGTSDGSVNYYNDGQTNQCYIDSICTNVVMYDGGYGGGWTSYTYGGGGGSGATLSGIGAPGGTPAGGGNGGAGGAEHSFYTDPPSPGGWGGGGGGGHPRYSDQGAAGGAGFAQVVYGY